MMSGGITEGASASGGMVVAPAFLALRNLPYIHRAPGEWISRAGARVFGASMTDVPFGPLGRLAFIFLATRSLKAGAIFVGWPSEVGDMFGLPELDRGAIAESLERVAFSRMQAPPVTECDCGCRPFSTLLPVADAFTYCPRSKRFKVRLSSAFMDESRDGIAIDPAAVAGLLDSPAALDLYFLLRRRFQLGDYETLPLHGEGGVFEMLKIARCGWKARQDMSERLWAVFRVWPECPYVLDLGARLLRCKLTPARPVTGPRTPRHEIPSDPRAVAFLLDFGLISAADAAAARKSAAATRESAATAPQATKLAPGVNADAPLDAADVAERPDESASNGSTAAPNPLPDGAPPSSRPTLPEALGPWYPEIAEAITQGMLEFGDSIIAWQAAQTALAASIAPAQAPGAQSEAIAQPEQPQPTGTAQPRRAAQSRRTAQPARPARGRTIPIHPAIGA